MSLRSWIALALCGGSVGCVGEHGIDWQGDAPADVALAALLPGERAALDTPTDAAAPPGDPAACAGSLRTVRHGDVLHGVWWSARPDGGARLVAARSERGGPWTTPVPVDTLDRSHAGCDRPAPAIAVDAATGYVSVTYFIRGPEGAGVFYAHSMSAGQTFEWPIVVVYGDRPARTAVAADSHVVAVAYEDPNTPGPRISLAVSLTDGHRFEMRPPPLSGGSVSAATPTVSVRGRRLTVAWSERARGAPPSAAVRVARVGTLPSS